MTALSNDLIQKVDCYTDNNHETFSELGNRFFEKFGYDKKNNRISTQVRNLQQITCSATRFADIEDFVKNQMGKEDKNKLQWRNLGDDVLKELKALRDTSQELASDDSTDQSKQMALRLRLARGWVRAVVSQYVYRVACDQSDKLIQKVDSYIDNNHNTFSELGDHFFEVFSYDKEKNTIRAQIRNLQQITCSATRFADIEDFVKNQMGKEKKEEPRWRRLGDDVLAALGELRNKSQQLDTDPANQMALRLRLARGWVRAVVSQYVYRVACDQSDKLIQKVDSYIDNNHNTFSELGDHFFEVFSYDKEKNTIRAQIRNLQQITCSATRFADIEDFVKNQMGKEKKEEPRWRRLGDDVLAALGELRNKSQQLDTDPANQMALRLRLARGWVRAVVSQYVYRVACDQMEGTS